MKLHNSAGGFLVVRHLGCMAAFLGFGLATSGIGVFAAWSTAGGSLISHKQKQDAVRARRVVLRETLPRLADIGGLSSFLTNPFLAFPESLSYITEAD